MQLIRVVSVILSLSASFGMLFSAGLCSAEVSKFEDLQYETARIREGADRGLVSPDRRERYLGMIFYLADQISRANPTDEKSKQAAQGRLVELESLSNSILSSDKDALGEKRGQFEWAYVSQADNSAQPIQINIPPDYDGKTPLPLVIALHGSGGSYKFSVNTSGAPPCIIVGVNGRGDSDYEGLGELDVVEAAKFAINNLNVDPKRVFAAGHSMGGGGALRMAARHQDIFTGALVVSGWATSLELGNLAHMPIDIRHGSSDWVVPMDFMRLAADDLKSSKRMRFVEYPGKGHSIYGIVNTDTPLAILGDASAGSLPRRIEFTTDQPSFSRGSWAGILRLQDVHRPGTIRASAGTCTIYAETHNVSQLEFNHLQNLFPGKKQISIKLDDRQYTFDDAIDDASFTLVSGRWLPYPYRPQRHVYQRRGCFNIYDGRPIAIVAPHGWRDKPALKALVDKWSSTSCPWAPQMPFGRIPVFESGNFDGRSFYGHLILIGGPGENTLVAHALPNLPVRIYGNTLSICGVGSYPLNSTALHLTYYNPDYPACRLVWLLNSTADTLPPDLPLPDGDGFCPDIVVHDISGKTPVLIAAANFGEHWSAPSHPRHERQIPVDLLSRRLARNYMRSLRADYVLYQTTDWGKDTWFGALKLTMSSLRALLPTGLQPVCRARLNRDQLADLMARISKFDHLRMLTDNPDSPEQIYDIVFDESLIWNLGCKVHYEFPKGSLTHAGADVSDYLDKPSPIDK